MEPLSMRLSPKRMRRDEHERDTALRRTDHRHPAARGGGLTTAELCRQHGISEQTYCRGEGKYGGIESGDAKKLKHLEEENRKLKHLVAELTLDNRALRDVLSKTW